MCAKGGHSVSLAGITLVQKASPNSKCSRKEQSFLEHFEFGLAF